MISVMLFTTVENEVGCISLELPLLTYFYGVMSVVTASYNVMGEYKYRVAWCIWRVTSL